jgi:hypothetical protein
MPHKQWWSFDVKHHKQKRINQKGNHKLNCQIYLNIMTFSIDITCEWLWVITFLVDITCEQLWEFKHDYQSHGGIKINQFLRH